MDRGVQTAGVLHTAARQEEGGFVDPEERARRSNEYAAGTRASVPQQRGARERDLLAAVGQLGDANEVGPRPVSSTSVVRLNNG